MLDTSDEMAWGELKAAVGKSELKVMRKTLKAAYNSESDQQKAYRKVFIHEAFGALDTHKGSRFRSFSQPEENVGLEGLGGV